MLNFIVFRLVNITMNLNHDFAFGTKNGPVCLAATHITYLVQQCMSHVQIARWAHCQHQVAFFISSDEGKKTLVGTRCHVRGGGATGKSVIFFSSGIISSYRRTSLTKQYSECCLMSQCSDYHVLLMRDHSYSVMSVHRQ